MKYVLLCLLFIASLARAASTSGPDASGDLSGTFPGPTVAKINGVALGSTTATSGNVLIGSGTQWVTHAISGDGTLSNVGVLAVTHINGILWPSSGTSGGVPWFNGINAIASSASLTGKDIIGGTPGAGPAPIGVSNGTGGLSDGQMVVGKTGDYPQYVSLGGDVASVTNIGVVTIANAAISAAKLASSAVDNSICNGRLTLTSGTPITTTDVTGASHIYFTPYKGGRIALYTGSAWVLDALPEIDSGALSSLVNAQAYDVFIYDSSGTPTMETLEWKNATVTMTIATPCVVTWTGHSMSTGNSITFTTSGALPTGVSANTQYFITVVDANSFKLSTSLANVAAGTFVNSSGTQSGTHTGHQPQARNTALTTQDGVLVKSGATTRRYVGTFFTTATTTTEDSISKRYIWNYYNRVNRKMLVTDATASWTYSSTTWRQANANAANQVNFIVGYDESFVRAVSRVVTQHSSATVIMEVGIGLDRTNGNDANITMGAWQQVAGSGGAMTEASYESPHFVVGFHTLLWVEALATNTATGTYEGTTNGIVSGLQATIDN